MTRRTFPIEPIRVQLMGIVMGPRFRATFKHGKGTREIDVDVPPKLILQLADAIRATCDGQCDSKTSRYDTGRYSHAVWHVLNPDQPMPCITGTIIDVEDPTALPSGDS